MFLFINTSNHQNINLALINKNGQILKWKKIKAKYQQSEKLLKSIDNLVPDIKKIKRYNRGHWPWRIHFFKNWCGHRQQPGLGIKYSNHWIKG